MDGPISIYPEISNLPLAKFITHRPQTCQLSCIAHEIHSIFLAKFANLTLKTTSHTHF